MANTKHISVIGAGFAGLSAASFLAKKGYKVTIFEKNTDTGGRARVLEHQGFRFDMGPSFYWMPGVFDAYFAQFGKKVSDYYELKRLSPSYRIVFGEGDTLDVPATLPDLYALFEQYEPGSSVHLKKFLEEAEYKYEVGINELVYKPGRSLTEFMDWRLISGAFRLHVFQSLHDYVRKYFTHPHLIQLLEFPVLFLGGTPKTTPALYSLMNYADLVLGTWYPMGGMSKIVEGMETLAKELGVEIKTGAPVETIEVSNNKAQSLTIAGKTYATDVIVGGADYHHVEQYLLPAAHRQYSPKYWDKRTMAPAALLFYIGVNKKLKNVLHHTLFFDTDFGVHAHEIYTEPQWPSQPLFYVSCPSLTDDTVAPEGHECLTILIPIAPGIEDTPEMREKYYDIIMDRMEKLTEQSIRPHVIFKQTYAHNDFQKDYNSFKGNAYGLANTLMQTAILKPSLKSAKVTNLFYTGQLTVPGPGVPPALISGQVVAKEIEKELPVLS